MSKSIEGLVQTSLNLGQLRLAEELLLKFSLRSSVSAEKQAMLENLQEIFLTRGGKVVTEGEYPAWEYREDSPLRDLMIETYVDMYGKKPVVDAIHAGLECGLLSGKRPELDCISIGPDLVGVHSVEEKLSIASTKRVWEFLLEVLKRSK
jgi:dipeptidase D